MPGRTLIKLIFLIIILVCSVVATVLLFLYSWYLAAILCALVSGLSFVMIIKAYNSSARKVAFMFDAIENDDFTFRFTGSSKRLRSDYFLNQSLNRIKDLVLKARVEAREREKYFEIILSQVNTGVIVFNQQGVIFRNNKKALQLLGVSQLTHIRQLGVIFEGLPDTFMNIGEGDSSMIKYYDEASEVSLNMACTFVNLQGNLLKIVALTDIGGDVDNVRVESWQRMSRVLTHEIMNSLAPITSLSETLLASCDPEFTRKGLEIIHSTSCGLTRFVENYRTMTRVPAPKFEELDLGMLVQREVELIGGQSVPVTVASSDCIVSIDKGQISQVIVNLVKNAIEASVPDGKVWVDVARNAKGMLYVDVSNTGELISDDVRDNIFVPFFTTKENGNGIGLSLSRQIMRLHEGSLSLATKPHTRFRMQF